MTNLTTIRKGPLRTSLPRTDSRWKRGALLLTRLLTQMCDATDLAPALNNQMCVLRIKSQIVHPTQTHTSVFKFKHLSFVLKVHTAHQYAILPNDCTRYWLKNTPWVFLIYICLVLVFLYALRPVYVRMRVYMWFRNIFRWLAGRKLHHKHDDTPSNDAWIKSSALRIALDVPRKTWSGQFVSVSMCKNVDFHAPWATKFQHPHDVSCVNIFI